MYALLISYQVLRTALNYMALTFRRVQRWTKPRRLRWCSRVVLMG
jgi:hypothetical protein